MSRSQRQRYLDNWQGEVDGATQYRAMASAEKNPGLARVYANLAAMEDKHRAFWEGKLAELGVAVPTPTPSWRVRVLVWVTRKFGPGAVLSTVAATERADRNLYAVQAEARGTSLTADEHLHDRVLDEILRVDKQGVSGNYLARIEGRHRAVGGNNLRAAVLGANDGLCSNLSLVMGVAGASASSSALLVTGVAGLLAGACSMALGEWLSVTSSRELAEREIQVESEEYDADPRGEADELQLIYESKGMKPEQAKALAQHMTSDKGRAIDALTREELGIDPEDRGGSPSQAALSSFVLFALGAIIPVLPYFFLSGASAFAASLGLSSLGLFVLGALGTIFTGKPALFAGGRQLVLGLLAAGVTYGLGKLLGVELAG
jgi:VIT1/CCC1 family predicted Fe2+/Mn2+ transporter